MIPVGPFEQKVRFIMRAIAVVLIIVLGLLAAHQETTKLKCHGQCATGNSTERHDGKKMCDKLTVCPTYGAE